jgi:hypothetical protein
VPVVATVDGYRIFFYSNEGSPTEPVHVHVRKAEREAKLWLDPDVRVEAVFGFNSGEVRDIIEHVRRAESEIRRRWDEPFGS